MVPEKNHGAMDTTGWADCEELLHLRERQTRRAARAAAAQDPERLLAESGYNP
jgi:hypothetical protein